MKPENEINSYSLRGDLDNIILMAIRKESSRRYATAEDLSKDISNYLNGLPVTARPNTFFYRTSKFYSRNKTASIIGLLLILSLIGGIIATTWQTVIARRERDSAQQRFEEVRQLSNSLLFEITPKIERLQGSTEAREILVKRALEYLDRLATQANNNVGLQIELAAAYEKVGELQGNSSRPNLGDFANALESYTKANNIRRNLPPTPENQSLLAENFRLLADVRFEQSDTEGAFRDSDEALRIYRELLSQNPGSTQLQISHIKTLIDHSQLHQFTNQYEKAIEFSKQALTEAQKLNPAEKDTQEILATVFTDLGFALSWNSQQKEAEIEMTKAVELAETLFAKYSNDARSRQIVWRVYMQASGIYESIKDDVSLQYAQKALKSAIEAEKIDSGDFQAKHNLMRSNYRVGVCSINLKKFSEAVSALDTAEKILRELIEREPKNRFYRIELARVYTVFGNLNLQKNSLNEALKFFQNSVEVRETILQSDKQDANTRRDLAVALKNIGEIHLKLKEDNKAKMSLETSLQILNELKQQNKLPDYDKKMLEELQKSISQIEVKS